MRIKSYFSGTVEAAISLARRELGDDALLLSSQSTSQELRHFGAYEVVFGYESVGDVAASTEPAGDLAAFLASRDVSPELTQYIRDSISLPEASEEDISRVIGGAISTAPSDPNASALVFVGPPGSGKT